LIRTKIETINKINIFNRDDEGNTSPISQNKQTTVLYPSQGEMGADPPTQVPEGYVMKEYVVRWVDTENKRSRTEIQYFFVREGTTLSEEELQEQARKLYVEEMNKRFKQ